MWASSTASPSSSSVRRSGMAKMRRTSAPMRSSLGRMVSPRPSSALMSSTLAGSRGGAPGSPRPRLTAVAMASATWLLPTPGSPSRRVSLPSGMYGSHSHVTASGSTSSRRIRRTTGAPVASSSFGAYRATDAAIRRTSGSPSGGSQRRAFSTTRAATMASSVIPCRRMVPARLARVTLRLSEMRMPPPGCCAFMDGFRARATSQGGAGASGTASGCELTSHS